MIHLVTDSTAYLPEKVKRQYNIHTISLKIVVGDETYDEEGGITQEAFYRLLDDVATSPTTSQPSAGEFVELYSSLLDEDDEIISIHISSELSGTVPNAMAAAQELAPDRIHVIDSKLTAVAMEPMVVAAAEALAAGKSRDEVLAMCDRIVQETAVFFSVDTLEYLHKGGRIGAASRFLGTLLNIKPVLYLSEGKIQPLDKVRTSKRARQRIVDEVVQAVGDKPVRVGVTHILDPKAAESVAAQAKERLNVVWMDITELGPVIGSHVGPGTIGIAACPVGEDGA